jgi:hypothetical protein
MDRFPLAHSHQKKPAWAVANSTITKSTPGSAIAPMAPSPLLSRVMKNSTFQKSVTRACRKARPSSLFSLLGDGL